MFIIIIIFFFSGEGGDELPTDKLINHQPFNLLFIFSLLRPNTQSIVLASDPYCHYHYHYKCQALLAQLEY